MENIGKCPLCEKEAKTRWISKDDWEGTYFYCNICGDYFITNMVHYKLTKDPIYKDMGPKISAYIRQRKINELSLVKIVSDANKVKANGGSLVMTIDEIINVFPKSISERIDRALINISKLSKFSGDFITIEKTDYPIFYVDSVDWDALNFMMKTLYDRNYLEFPLSYSRVRISSSRNDLRKEIRLTAKGWDRVIEIENNKNYLSKQAFVAMWFKDSYDKIYENGIKKAIEEAGYTPMRIKESEHNNKICDQIIAEIRKSKFVICDFTGQRGGVYFEAGFTMGLGRPVIWTCRKDETKNLHFDTRQYNHIEWENENDLYKKLFNRIKATII